MTSLSVRCESCHVFEYNAPGGEHGISGYHCRRCINSMVGRKPVTHDHLLAFLCGTAGDDAAENERLKRRNVFLERQIAGLQEALLTSLAAAANS